MWDTLIKEMLFNKKVEADQRAGVKRNFGQVPIVSLSEVIQYRCDKCTEQKASTRDTLSQIDMSEEREIADGCKEFYKLFTKDLYDALNEEISIIKGEKIET
jgi:hypothetical protein